MTPDGVLEVDRLTGGYGDIRAVTDVTLTVRKGAITVVLGRNGAGKTSMLSAVAGLLRVSGGSVRFHGKDITRLRPSSRARMGLAFVQENKRVFKRLTVEQNLELGAYGRRFARRHRREAVERAFGMFPVLAAKAKVGAGSLSGGQQQMLAIAQALVPEPEVVMLDEPSAGLAPKIVEEVFNEVARLRTLGLGVLIVEQMVEEVLPIADQVVVLDLGRVIASEPAACVDAGRIKEMYLGPAASKLRP